MNTLTNMNNFPIGNSLDGVNIITEEIGTLSLLVDGTNSMLADLNMNFHVIKNMDAGVDGNDAVNKSQLDLKADTVYVNTQDNLRLKRDGTDVMTGSLNMNSNKIINLANGTNNGDAVNRSQLNTKADTTYVNTQLALKADITYVDASLNLLRSDLTSDIDDLETYVDASLNLLRSDLTSDIDDLETYVDASLNLLRSDLTNDINDLKTYTDSSLNLLRSDLTNDINDLTKYTDSSLNSLKSYVDSQDNLKVNKAGDTMTGNLEINLSNPSLNIRATNENENATLYLSTPFQNGTGFKTALIAEGITNWSRANLHFCLNGSVTDNNADATITDAKMTILNNGNVGIGTGLPGAKLEVNGSALIGGSLGLGIAEPTQQLDVGGSAIIRTDLGVSGSATIGTGLSISNGKLTINETTGTLASATTGTIVLDHQNSGGASSIVFKSKVNATSDYGYIEYRDNYNSGNSENSALIIGVENDATNPNNIDSIYLKTAGTDRVVVNGNGTSILKNASFYTTLNTTETTIRLNSGNTIYDFYNLSTSASAGIQVPGIGSTDTTMVNRVVTISYPNLGSIAVESSSVFNLTINVNGLSSSFLSITSTNRIVRITGTSTIGYYTYIDAPYSSLDTQYQLTLQSNYGVNSNSEFTGIRFNNNNSDCGYIKTETNRLSSNSNMEFQVRQATNIITPLVLNSNANVNTNLNVEGTASFSKQVRVLNSTTPSTRDRLLVDDNVSGSLGYLYFNDEGTLGRSTYSGSGRWTIDKDGKITRNAWNSGELIQTKIYNQNTSGSGVLTINSGWTTIWKTLTFTTLNSPNNSMLVVEVFAPYCLLGSANDETFIKIDDTTATNVQTIVKTGQRWTNANGGGTRSGAMLPILGSYTPSQFTTNKTRTIEIEFESSSDDTLYICKIIDGEGNVQDQNNYTIKISEYQL